MIPFDVIADLALQTPSKIVLFVMDGLGGFPRPDTGKTELETARTPNLDAIARESICGLTVPIAPGITPGSGPAHLALFGYDPIADNVGRGALSALGVGFHLEPNDLAARINFATVEHPGAAPGPVIDRRAGRISTETNRALIAELRRIRLPGAELFLETESMHRAVVVFRAPNLSDALTDTDPQRTGVPPLPVTALAPAARASADLVNRFLAEANATLANHHPANAILLRGFAQHPNLPRIPDIYKLRPAAIATYPMYRGFGRLVGMDVLETGTTFADEMATLKAGWDAHDFVYIHYKSTDTTGEDGNFDAKVRTLEEVDRLIPELLALKPDVLAVSGDHSTPSHFRSHSWHPVPFMLRSANEIPDSVQTFDERACAAGTLGRFPAHDVMLMLMANALKLEKFGA